MFKILIVKQFAYFYSHLGFQFLPFSHRNTVCVYTFPLNMVIFATCFHSLFFSDPWNSSEMNLGMRQKRPLMAMLTGHLMDNVYLVLFHCNLIYYFFNGRKIIKLLDHNLFCDVFNKLQYKYPFYLITLFQFINCFVSNPNTFFVYKNTLSQYFNLFTTFIITLSTYLNFSILYYSQLGSWIVLLKINENNQMSNKKIVSKVHLLSRLNKQINSLMSFPFLLQILISIFDILSISCSSLIVLNNFIFFNLYYIFQNVVNFLFLFHIVYLNSQIFYIFSSISQKLINSDIIKVIHLKRNTKSHLYPQLAENFKETFKLKLFELVDVNYHILLATCFIILNYVIFLYQTY